MSVSKTARKGKAKGGAKTARGAAAGPRTASRAGRVLTVKQLPEAAYQAFHRLPHGVRMKTLRAVLSAAAAYAKYNGPGWHERMMSGDVEFSS